MILTANKLEVLHHVRDGVDIYNDGSFGVFFRWDDIFALFNQKTIDLIIDSHKTNYDLKDDEGREQDGRVRVMQDDECRIQDFIVKMQYGSGIVYINNGDYIWNSSIQTEILKDKHDKYKSAHPCRNESQKARVIRFLEQSKNKNNNCVNKIVEIDGKKYKLQLVD